MHKLFELKCNCGRIYSPEDHGYCPSCGVERAVHKELLFNIPEFFQQVEELEAQNKRADSIDVIFDAFYHLYDRFDIMNDILGQADVAKLSGAAIVSLLSRTFKYSSKVPNHAVFYQRAEQEFIKRDKTPHQVSGLLSGLKGNDKFWDDMELLGAPEWLTGPKPE